MVCEALEELMKDELDAMREQGLQQGIEKGIEQGIQIFIEACKELEIPKQITLTKLETKFHMSSKNESEKYLAKYWK